jgi:hypothetical protein
MRADGLLKYIVQGDESLDAFRIIIADYSPILEYLEDGTLIGFWWVTPVYAHAVFFHACLFKSSRYLAVSIFADIRRRLAAAGVTDIFLAAPRKRRDLTAFFRKIGAEYTATIGKEIELWLTKAQEVL